MKICYDTLDGIKLTKNGYFIKNSSTTFIYKDSCLVCGLPYLSNKHHETEHCSKSCSHKNKGTWLGKKHSIETRNKMSRSAVIRSKSKEYSIKLSEAQLGYKNHNWKGGISKLNLPLYSTYMSKLPYDEVRCTIKYALELLEVRCTKCGCWFIPDTNTVQNRMKFVNEKITSECRFYCSNSCKHNCSIFRQYKYPKGYVNKQDLEYSKYDLSTWSKEVLNRVSYKCEYCGNTATIAHHIIPKKVDSFYALDPDNGIACCKECHHKYGHKDECSTGILARIKC